MIYFVRYDKIFHSLCVLIGTLLPLSRAAPDSPPGTGNLCYHTVPIKLHEISRNADEAARSLRKNPTIGVFFCCKNSHVRIR